MIYLLLTLALLAVAQTVVIEVQHRELKRRQAEARLLREVLAWEADAEEELL